MVRGGQGRTHTVRTVVLKLSCWSEEVREDSHSTDGGVIAVLLVRRGQRRTHTVRTVVLKLSWWSEEVRGGLTQYGRWCYSCPVGQRRSGEDSHSTDGGVEAVLLVRRGQRRTHTVRTVVLKLSCWSEEVREDSHSTDGGVEAVLLVRGGQGRTHTVRTVVLKLSWWSEEVRGGLTQYVRWC